MDACIDLKFISNAGYFIFPRIRYVNEAIYQDDVFHYWRRAQKLQISSTKEEVVYNITRNIGHSAVPFQARVDYKS